jgi:hypothetical protein
MRDLPLVNIPAVYTRARCQRACLLAFSTNAHILRCRPLGRLGCDSSSDFFARGRRQDNTLDIGEYHPLLEALGRSAAYIRLSATVSEMSSRANSCIVKIKLSSETKHQVGKEVYTPRGGGGSRTSILRRCVRCRFPIEFHRRVSHRRHGRGATGRG